MILHFFYLLIYAFVVILFWNAARGAHYHGKWHIGSAGSFWQRVRYARLFVWIGFAARERNWKAFASTLSSPFDWFEYGSGLDCD